MSNSFLDCIQNICGLELSSLVANYKYTVFGGNTVVVEGHKGILQYSLRDVVFGLGKSNLQIIGDNLQIKCLQKHFAVIVGKVLEVKVVARAK